VRTSPDEARQLLIHLGEYFRNNLQIGKEFISIKDELKHVDAYLKIEKARFGDKLQVVYDIPEDLDYKIPPLLIQPIIENAVKHGIFPKENGGVVSVVIEDLDALLIRVIDDGIGMPESVREDAVGLKNVEKRLEAVYGQAYSFQIKSEETKGTEVIIKLPKEAV
jgi:two-component system sensor histidine kinase LytS